MNISETLKTARALLASGRWLQEVFSNIANIEQCRNNRSMIEEKKGCFCTVGALLYTQPENFPEFTSSLMYQTRKYISYLIRAFNEIEDRDVDPEAFTSIGQLYGFNDDENRTLDEVVALYDKAIALAEADGV